MKNLIVILITILALSFVSHIVIAENDFGENFRMQNPSIDSQVAVVDSSYQAAKIKNEFSHEDVGVFSTSNADEENKKQETLFVVPKRVLDKPNAEFRVNTNGMLAEFFSAPELRSYRYLSLKWDFGDGFISREFDPMHKYAKPGSYNVILSVVRINEERDLMAFAEHVKTVEIIDPKKVQNEARKKSDKK